MNIGNKVRYSRERLDWTTQDLATRAGLSQAYISEIENHRKSPSAKALMRIAQALNVPGEFLLRDDVKTIEEFNIDAALKSKIDSSKYLPYFVTVDEAISEGITPEEIKAAIQFIKSYKAGR